MKTNILAAICLAICFWGCGEEKVWPEMPLESNLAEMSIVLDRSEVFLGEEVTFNITGRADFLTFYSGEEGNRYGNTPVGGVEHRGKIDTYTYAFTEEGEYEVFFLGRSKNGEERAIGPFVIEVSRDTNPLLTQKTIKGQMAFGFPTTSTFLFDLAPILSHNVDEAFSKQQEIDFFIVWSTSGYPVFMTLGAGLDGWAVTRNIRDNFTIFNSGTVMRLDAPTAEEITQFESLARRDDLVTLFANVQNSITSRPNYSLTNNGPALRFDGRGMAVGDIVYFKSDAVERDLYAACRIVSIPEGTAGQNGEIELEIKSILYL